MAGIPRARGGGRRRGALLAPPAATPPPDLRARTRVQDLDHLAELVKEEPEIEPSPRTPPV